MIEKIKPLWGKFTYAEIAKKIGSTAEAVRKTGRKHGLPAVRQTVQNRKLTPQQEIVHDQKVGTLGKRLQQTDSKYRLMLEENENLKALLEATRVVGSANTYTIPSQRSRGDSTVTAVAVASDWHYEETVHSANVNGLNEFNRKIAKDRAEKFFVSVARLIHIFSKESSLKTLVLALLGDFINGQLREEAMENNSTRPMNALIEVSEIIASGIHYLLDNTDVKLVIPCHSGNHARVTKKVHVSTEAGNSLEFVMYHWLAAQFQKDKRVEFIIPTSYLSYVDIAGFTVRFSHGHALKFAGGIGGLFIPAYKAISQWNKARRADLDVFGHFHQSKDGGNFICNGSLIGYNEYASFIKADFEKPKQTFFLVDHKRQEKTITSSIFVT